MIEPPATVERIMRISLAALPSFVCPANSHGWDQVAHIHVSAFAARPVEDGQWVIIDSEGGVHLMATMWEESTKPA